MTTYRLANEMKGLADLGIAITVYVNRGKPSSGTFKSEILEAMLAEKTPCQPKENGFLIEESNEAHFYIVLRMPTRTDVAVVLASDGKEKKLSRLSNLSENGAEYLTLKRVATYTIMDGCTTKPPDNSFKVISTANNVLSIFEVGIATRIYKAEGCLHFLTVQEVYTGQLYFDEELQDIMVPPEEYPGYRNWRSLRELIPQLVDKDQLPREVRPISKQIPPVTQPNQGRVLFFNASTGFGLAKIAGGQVAGLHWRELNIEEPFPYMMTGDEITFNNSYTEKGYLKLADVTPV